MNNKDKKSGAPRAAAKAKRKINPIVLIVAVGLALVLALGGTLVTVGIINEANSVVSYNGIYVSRGVATYLAATYKYDHIKGLNQTVDEGIIVDDNPYFWGMESSEGETFGDGLRSATENYIRGVVIGSYLFDSVTALTA